MTVRRLDAAPNLALLYAKAPVTGLSGGGELPDEQLELAGVAVDRDHLAAYNRVCGYPLTDTLPPTYPHLTAFALSMELMARRDFPLPLLGMVHIGNVITARRPITADEALTVRVRTVDLRPHPKGRVLDVLADAEVEGEGVWESRSTYLHRGDGDGAAPVPGDRDWGEPPQTARWRVAADTGRRYAAVSGDPNPIHLHPLTARAFGFPRAIAHGMWTKARCLAALGPRLPEAFTVEVRFDVPVRLPSTVAFHSAPRDGGWAFAVRRPRDGAPHLRGAVTAGRG